ncbi:MAG: DUF4402 domain-containing protein [Sphingomicrobium sp.]
MRLTLSLAAVAATFAAASPAFAQAVTPTATATAEAEARGVVLLPLTLTKTSDLDFGTIIADVTLPGSVAIDADDGSRTVTGGVIEVPNFTYSRGLFQGAGTEDQDVALTFNPPAVLTSGSNTITVTSMVLDQSDSRVRTIDATKAFSVGVGGEFAIDAGQAPGLYTAQFDLTADYQ